jgi:hypothetical protein
MNIEKERFSGTRKLRTAGVALALWLAGSETERLLGQTASTANTEKKIAATPGRFYCNIKALDPAQRTHHKELTDKLIARRSEIVETEKGYEFQYRPSNVSLAELADWVADEGKCCPFLDFHIDLEREGRLLCLRLTGEEGSKPFIRAEFQLPTK